ncbi:MAG: N-formylglutamate amidohydrolase [Rhodospirillaceae bacterium]|nr:N-formylglutamate amidohydrolase [Rhodospirillaceae bacterium]
MSSRSVKESSGSPLLGDDDPAPATVLNAAGRATAVVVCDHGGEAVPAKLDGLGLDPADRARHIAWDIGASATARELAQRLDAPAVLSSFSRLVIDLNRPPDDLTSIREISDGVLVPGNRNLSADDTAQRVASVFEPYHDAVSAAMDRAGERVAALALISIHSFTPVMKGFERPWHIGVLFGPDARMAKRFIAALSKNADVCVGANKPYSGYDLYGYTVETHAMPKGYPNILLEIRQDLIDTQHGAEKWAAIIADALAPILDDQDLYRPLRPDEAEYAS